MLNVSNAFNEAFKSPTRQVLVRVTMKNVVYTNNDVFNVEYTGGSITGETFNIGSVFSNSIKITFTKVIEAIKQLDKIKLEFGIVLADGSREFVSMGYFFVDKYNPDRNANRTVIEALDQMTQLERVYKSKLTYPARIKDVALEIANLSGSVVDQASFERLSTSAIIKFESKTYRQAIGLIAQFGGGFAIFDRDGKLSIRTLSDPNFSISTAEYFSRGLVKNETMYTLGGISCKVSTKNGDTTTDFMLQSGSPLGNQIVLENSSMTQILLDGIYQQLKNTNYYPYTLSWRGNPALEAGDWISMSDTKANSFKMPNLSYKLSFSGGLKATSSADTSSVSQASASYRGPLKQQVLELQGWKSAAGGWTYTGTTEPSTPKEGDVWFKPNGPDSETWIYEGGKWVFQTSTAGIRQVTEEMNQAQKDIVEAKKAANNAVDKANANVQAIEANTQLINDVNAIANTAKSQAQTAATNAQTALTSANTAITNANKAISDAGKLGENVESLSALATTAENNANTALTNARNAINQITQLNSDLEDTDGQVSTLTDNLNGFKQTVYTKTQTDTKIATVQSDVNGFKTSVSNTYATKSEIQGIKAGVRNYICEVAWTTKGYLATNGSVTNSNDNLVSSFIDVDASKAWIFQQFESATSGSVYVAFYDTNKNLVGSRVTLADGQTGTTASNVTYMRLSTPYKDTFGGRYKFEFGTVKSDWTQAPEDTQFIYINLQTQVDQTANAVSAKADKTTVDQISGRVDTAEGSITTMAGQINLKANKSTVDTITNRVSATEASLSLQDGKITTLTTKTNGLDTSLSSLTQDYNGFKTTVYSKTQTDTKISTVQSTVDNFKTTVSNTYSSKSETDSKVTAVQANVDKIGNYTAYANSADGTDGFTTVYPNLNLLEDGKFAKPISLKWNTDGTAISKDNITGYFKVIFNGTGSYNRAYYTAGISTIPIGQKYSVYIKAYSLEDSLNIKLGSVNTSQAVTVTKNGNVPKIYKVEGLVRGTSDTLGIFWGLTTTLGTLFISEIKVEPGSTATPYMPSEKELTSDDIPKYVGYSVRQSENPEDFSWQPYGGLNSYNITKATTSIEQNSKDIALKANKTEVDTLSGKVSTAEGSITTMAGQIALKANQADVNTTNGKVSSLESSFTVQSGQISALNTKTDGHTTQIGSLQSSYNGLSSTVATVQTSVSNINTSNTNLLIRKNEVKDSMVESDGTIKNWNGSSVIGYSDRISVTGGESLYFSQYYANMSADNYFRYAFYNSTGTLITRAVNNTINFLVVVPSGASYLRVSYATANKVKVERGNSNTGFVLNPEDTATFVQYSNLSQTVSSLQSTVADKASTAQVASQITQSATAVTSNVQSWTNNKLTAYSTTQQTDSSITSAVASKADKSQITQLSDMINLRVSKGDVTSQINLEAGRTLIDTKQLLLNANTVKFSGSAFIPDAMIQNLTASKINTGTLNAANVNIINLNASNISAGTITGPNLSINLNSGEVLFQKGIIKRQDGNFSVDITNGILESYTSSGGYTLRDGEISFRDTSAWKPNSREKYGGIGYNNFPGGIWSGAVSGISVRGNEGWAIGTSNSDVGGTEATKGSLIAGGLERATFAAKKQITITAGDVYKNSIFSAPPAIQVGTGNSSNEILISSKLTTIGDVLVSELRVDRKATISQSLTANSLNVTGSKNAIHATRNGVRATPAYETAESYLGDIGSNYTREDCEVWIDIDKLFSDTVNTDIAYQVFLQAYDDTNFWVADFKSDKFLIKSDKPLSRFAWEIKAKRRGYENDRLVLQDDFDNKKIEEAWRQK